MREIVLKTTKLTKRYRSFTALDNADMTVYSGDIYGLVGRNGAGKTTIMKILVGLTEKTSGNLRCSQKKVLTYKKKKDELAVLLKILLFSVE